MIDGQHRNRLTIRPEQIGLAAVVHQIFGVAFLFALLAIHQELLCNLLHVLLASGQADKARMKGVGILCERVWRVALGINGDEKRLHLFGQFGMLLFEQVKPLHQFLQVDGADIRAIGVAEIDRPVIARQRVAVKGLAIFVRQGEMATDPGTGKWRAVLFLSARAATCGKGQKGRGSQHGQKSCCGARGKFVHGVFVHALLLVSRQGSGLYKWSEGMKTGSIMNIQSRFLKAAAYVLLGLAIPMASPAQAQFSKSYEFLKAVRDQDGQTVTDMVNEPGTRIVNTHDRSTGETALHIVTAARNATWIRFLLSKGAEPDAQDNEGMTPLMTATMLRFTDGMEALIAGGANVNHANRAGETALIRAVQIGDTASVRLLMKNGADPNVTDNRSGMSALDYAERDGRNPAILDLLRAKNEAKPVETFGPIFSPGS